MKLCNQMPIIYPAKDIQLSKFPFQKHYGSKSLTSESSCPLNPTLWSCKDIKEIEVLVVWIY